MSTLVWRKPGDCDKVDYFRYPPVDPTTGTISAKEDAILMGQMRHSDVPSRHARVGCSHLMDDHGWIDTPGGGRTVCPGDVLRA